MSSLLPLYVATRPPATGGEEEKMARSSVSMRSSPQELLGVFLSSLYVAHQEHDNTTRPNKQVIHYSYVHEFVIIYIKNVSFAANINIT